MIKNNKLVILGAIALSALTLTGCSQEIKEAQSNLDNKVVTVLNNNRVVISKTENVFTNYKFLAADFNDSTSVNQYDVFVNGVSKIKDSDKKAYLSLEYTFDKSLFDKIDSKDTVSALNKLSEIVENNEPISFSCVESKDLSTFNKSLTSVIDCPIANYKLYNGLVYSVSNMNFDEQKNYVSFLTKEDMEYSRTQTETTYGVTGVDANGNPKFGLVTRVKTYYENFFQASNVYIKVTDAEMDSMKQDSSLVFDKFTDVVKNNQKDQYVIQSVEVATENEFNTSMKDIQELNF